MRWWVILAFPIYAGWMVPGSAPEIGVLSCLLGRAIDIPTSDQISAASETREILCSYKSIRQGPAETYAGLLKSINIIGPLPDNATLLWLVRAPAGTQPSVGLLQQVYSTDVATPAGHAAPLVGESKVEISLHALADKMETSASQEKSSPTRYLITSVDLKLIITTS